MTATARPWRVEQTRSTPVPEIWAESEPFHALAKVLYLHGSEDAGLVLDNAAFIVKAVNSHDALVAVGNRLLDALAAQLVAVTSEATGEAYEHTAQAKRELQALLDQVGEE